MRKKKLGFKAIAVVAAINPQGRVVAQLVRDGAIEWNSFCDFLDRVHEYTQGAKSLLMLDNLGVHYKTEVRAKARSCNVEFCFNGTYSSKYMPIERLWSWSKSRFTR